MISAEPKLTTGGKGLLIRAVGGETITFTRFKVGDGELTTPAEGLTDLVHSRFPFSITSIESSESGYVRITGAFDSTMITEDFTWRELGIFCKGEDDTETLYAYANDGDNAGLLRANATSVQTEQNISFVIAIGEAENVTAIIAESMAYALKSDFDAHVSNKNNPHNVTKAQVGLGNVPNVTTNDQTPTYTVASTLKALVSKETLSTAFGKLAKAVNELISHIADKNNPHGTTPGQIGAALVTHAHSAADITAGTLSVARGGTGVGNYSDLKKALNLGESVSDPIPVTGGGTGVTSLEEIRNEIGLGTNLTELTVEHGGTGVSTLNDLRAELGLGDDATAPLDAEHGGTGINTQTDFDARFGYPVVIGDYTGDSVKERVLELGFTPSFVIVYSAFGSVANNNYHSAFFARPGQWATTVGCTDRSVHPYAPDRSMPSTRQHVAVEVVDGGIKFYDTSNDGANYSGWVYCYAAFR